MIEAMIARLPLAALRLRFARVDGWAFDDWPGPIIRGAFGAALLEHSCQSGGCPPCKRPQTCTYGLAFDLPHSDENASRLAGVQRQKPHPMALRVGLEADPRVLRVGLELFGTAAARQVGALAQALIQAADGGFGKQRLRGRLLGVEALDLASGRWLPAREPPRPYPLPPALIPTPTRLRVALRTPLRLQRRGQMLGREQPFEAAELLRAVLRRLTQLVAHYGIPGRDPDYPGLSALAGQIDADPSGLRWTRHARWSARQQAVLPLNGLTGELKLAGPMLPVFFPLLRLSERIGAGKGTIHGLGEIVLDGSA